MIKKKKLNPKQYTRFTQGLKQQCEFAEIKRHEKLQHQLLAKDSPELPVLLKNHLLFSCTLPMYIGNTQLEGQVKLY